MKKRAILCLLSLVLALSLCSACGKTNKEDKEDNKKTQDKVEDKNSNTTQNTNALLKPGKYLLAGQEDGDIYICFYEDGSFTRLEGQNSEYLIFGKYVVDKDQLMMIDSARDKYLGDYVTVYHQPRVNLFKIEDGYIRYVEDGSENFEKITLTSDKVFDYSEPVKRDTAAVTSINQLLDIDYGRNTEYSDMYWGIIDDIYGSYIYSIDDDEDSLYSDGSYEIGGIGFEIASEYSHCYPVYDDGKLVDVHENTDNDEIKLTYTDEFVDNDDFTAIVREYSCVIEDVNWDNYYKHYFENSYFVYFTNYKVDSPELYVLFLYKDYFTKDQVIEIAKSIKDI